MSDWTPEELDKLFQEGSNHEEFEYNEAAWGQMEALLDRKDRNRRLFWWLFAGLVSLIMLIILYANSYFIFKQNASNTSNPNTEIRENSTTKVTEAATSIDISPKIEDNPSVESTTNNLASVKTTKQQEAKPNTNTIDVSTNKATPVQGTIIKDNEPKTSTSIKSTKRSTIKETVFNNQGLLPTAENSEKEATSIFDNHNEELPEPPIKNLQPVTHLNYLPSLFFTIKYVPQPIDFNIPFSDDRINLFEEKEQQENRNHLVLGILLGKEISFVGSDGMSDMKWKAGLNLAYRYGERHSIKIGANYSQKNYTAAGPKYKAAAGFWHKQTAPLSASGVCDILEISVSESYFFKGHSKRGFFANVGLTSYFLLKEQYNYAYTSQDPALLWSWGTQNENRNLFGIGEVSFGYNLPFSNNSSLQLAPYMQIPLTGVGHGQVKLFSSGVILRYNFHLR